MELTNSNNPIKKHQAMDFSVLIITQSNMIHRYDIWIPNLLFYQFANNTYSPALNIYNIVNNLPLYISFDQGGHFRLQDSL